MPPPGHYHRQGRMGLSVDEPGRSLHVGSTYLRLLRYARRYWVRVALVFVVSVVASLISTLPAQVVGVAVDEMTASGLAVLERPAGPAAAAAPPPKPAASVPIAAPLRALAAAMQSHWPAAWPAAMTSFGVLAACFLGLHLVSGLISVIQQFIMAYVGQRLIYDMRNEVYTHLQRLSMRYFENQRTGDVMSRVVNDVGALEQVIVGPVIGFLTDMFRLAWVLYFCVAWDWQLTAMALLVGPLLMFSTLFFGRLIRGNFRRLRTCIGDLNATANDNISGIRVIKGFSREAHEAERFRDRAESVFEENLKVARLFAVFRPTIQLFTQVGSAVVLSYGGYKVVTGAMSPGTFVVFFTYLGMLYGPITGLTRFWNFIQRAVASVERVFEVLDTEPEITDAPGAVELPDIRGKVDFEGVHFAYDGKREVLTNVSLAAQPGQLVAFVGPSGAGKSTLTNLILRFYDPTEGRILVDGRDVREISVRSLRRRMAIVLQDPFLFNDTVKANIAYGKLGATEAEIAAAARAANADEFIHSLPDGYGSLVGERGVKLSGGQKQRLSIARAILADPRILILDEATSSVDTETEALIQEAISHLVADRTTFVIAHRLSTVLHADLIVVLDQGRVVEQGTHAELLAADKLYRRLFDMQFRNGAVVSGG